MRKLFTLTLVFITLFLGVNAQHNNHINDHTKERTEKRSRIKKPEASIKFLKGTPTKATQIIECMPEASYSNAPADYGAGIISNTDRGLMVAHKVEDFNYPVDAIRVFGIQAILTDTWYPMNEVDPFEFEIKFYEDNAGTPGSLVSIETVSINHVNTGEVFNDIFHIFYWDYTPSAPITGLTETFWIGMANTNPDAWFMWLENPGGLGSSAQYDNSTSTWTNGMSCGICIVPVLADPGAPDIPANMVVTPEPTGDLGASITWTNPALTYAGDPLTELTAVFLLVNDETTPEYVIDNPTINGDENYDFTATNPGYYKFSVYGTNSVGAGPRISQTVWLGNDVPGAPTNVLLVASGNDAVITWDAPTSGLHEGYIDPANTSYSLIRMPDEIVVATSISTETFTDNTVPGIGDYLYIVTAHNDEGVGGNAASNTALLASEGYLFFESFEEGFPPIGWTSDGWEQGYYGFPNSGTEWAFSSTFSSTLSTPTVTLPAGEGHEFSFFYMAETADYPQGLDVLISVDGGAYQNVAELTDIINTAYIQFKVNLIAYAGSDVQFQLLKTDTSPIYGICVDDISLYTLPDNDLAALSIGGNPTPTVDIESFYTVSVENHGILPQDTYTVKLMREGGVELGTLPGTSIAPGEVQEFSFPWTPQAGDEGATFIYGLAELSGDEQSLNNQTANLSLAVQPVGVTVITIGTGTALPSERIPFDFYSRTSFAQTLYYPNEIGLDRGILNAITYTNHFVSDLPAKQVKVWVGETDVADLSDAWVDPTTLSLVYDGTKHFPSGENTIVIPLDAPYIYTGGTLVIYTNSVWEDVNGGPNDKFYGTQDANSKRTYHISEDGTEPLDPNNPGTGTVSDWHPNTVLFLSTDNLGSLEGTVTEGGNPLEGVEVSVEGTTAIATTDLNGNYAFPALLAGTLDVNFQKHGYFTHIEENVEIVADEETTIDVSLTIIPSFTVTGIAKGNDEVLLEGARASLTGYSDHNETAGANGVFSFENVYEGTYELAIALEGYEDYFNATLAVNSETAIGGVLDLGTLLLTEIISEPYGLVVNINHDEQSAELTWNNALGFSDDFESYDDFSHEFSPWTSVDVDGVTTIGFYDITFPGMGLPMAGIIFNPKATTPAMTNSFAHSGDKYVAVFNLNTGAPCDDWIISPKTTIMPNGQVSFWARGGNAMYSQEEFQVAVSTTDATPASFTAISPIVTCPEGSDEWVQYTYSLSNYADQDIYVGIHVTSAFQFYFCLDDFSISAAESRALIGYNVYLDNLENPVNTAPIIETSYIFEDLALSTYTAGVEAIYTTGVSEMATIDFDLTLTGMNSGFLSKLEVYPNPFNNVINISNADRVNRVIITNIVGQHIMDIPLLGKKTISTSVLDSGIYLISFEGFNGERTVRKMIKR